jgi:2,3,4,5-tetrahydropyridine-2-carboxylate N-succinyltransferase
MEDLQRALAELEGLDAQELRGSAAWNILDAFITLLDRGVIRAAEPDGNGSWIVHQWVKKGILQLFRAGQPAIYQGGMQLFYDKDTLPLKNIQPEHGLRIVPGGSAIRAGAFLEPGVICMPPMYINIGAYIGAGTMIDSHALIGTCAQIGQNVHISAAAQIGGVLEPAGARPVIIEDQVMIGGNCGVYEGVRIGHRAVLGSGVVLNASTVVYDLVNEKELRSAKDMPLEIPANAVVVPGTRQVKTAFGKKNGLGIAAPLIVKYRDEKTDARTALESALR